MFVSVVTPSRNQARFIEQTILSVKGQTYASLEHIIVDGASDDGTVDIIRKYAAQYDLRWVSEPDEGQSDALNKGISMAKGDVIGWLNSDDTYMAGAVAAAVDALEGNPAVGWTYGDGYWIDELGTVLRLWRSRPFDLHALIAEGQYIVQPTVFVRRSLLTSVGLLDTSLHYSMDTDLFLRLALSAPGLYIPRVLAMRRLHADAKTVRDADAFVADRIAVLDKVFGRKDLPREVRDLERRAYAKVLFGAGCQAFRAGDAIASRNWLWRALRVLPAPWRRQTWKAALVLAESLVGARLYVPGERGRARASATPNIGQSVAWGPDAAPMSTMNSTR